MNEMFRGFEFIRAYINDLLIITEDDWSYHLNKFEPVLQNLKDNRIKCNIKKSFFGKTQMGYLGFWVMQTAICLVNKKLEAIVNMTPSKNIKQLRSFIGLVNYYRDIWARRSHLLQLLTALTSNKLTFKWTDVKQQAFNKIEQIVARDTLLIYLDPNERFDIYAYGCNFQIRTVINHNGKPIALDSGELTPAQLFYTVTEKELLSIVETLKELCTILLDT